MDGLEVGVPLAGVVARRTSGVDAPSVAPYLPQASVAGALFPVFEVVPLRIEDQAQGMGLRVRPTAEEGPGNRDEGLGVHLFAGTAVAEHRGAVCVVRGALGWPKEPFCIRDGADAGLELAELGGVDGLAGGGAGSQEAAGQSSEDDLPHGVPLFRVEVGQI